MTTTPFPAPGTVRATSAPTRPALLTALTATRSTYLRRPVVWTLVGVWLLQVVVFAYLVNALVYSGDPSDPVMSDVVRNLRGDAAATWPLASMPMYGAPVFTLLGALAAGSPFRYGTLRVVVPRAGGRMPVVLASWLCVAALSVVVGILTMVASVATSAALAGVVDRPVSVPTVGELAAGAGAGALIVLALASLGFVLALVARSVLVGVVVGVGWVIGVEVLLLSMLSPVAGWVDALRGVLPAGASGSVAAGVGVGPELALASTVGVTELLPVTASLLVLGGWTAACVVVAVMVFQRRDLR